VSIDDINLFDPATQEDWFPTYRRLRDEAPVYRVPETELYVVTRYADVMHVLRHQDVFPTGASIYRSSAAREVYERRGWSRITPLSINPPEHGHYRAIVDPHFDAQGAERWRPEIERVIEELLTAVEARVTASSCQRSPSRCRCGSSRACWGSPRRTSRI
jgi:cytochrome P450